MVAGNNFRNVENKHQTFKKIIFHSEGNVLTNLLIRVGEVILGSAGFLPGILGKTDIRADS